MAFNKTCTISCQPFLDRFQQCYINILTINHVPAGPLREKVIQIQTPPLSEFKAPGPCCPLPLCALALKSLCCGGIMREAEISDLFSYLLANGYTINEGITKILTKNDTENKRTICFITYVGHTWISNKIEQNRIKLNPCIRWTLPQHQKQNPAFSNIWRN